MLSSNRKTFLLSWLLVSYVALLSSGCGGGGSSAGGGVTGPGSGSGGGTGSNQISIQVVEPSRAMVGVPVGTLTLVGTNFTANSQVLFDGLPIQTIFQNPTLEGLLSDSSWNVPRIHTVQVSDPANGESNVATYQVYASQPGPHPFIGQLTRYMSQSLLTNSLVPDVNGDGRADLVVGVSQGPNLSQFVPELMLGQADGTFSWPVPLGSFTLPFPPTVVLAGDFNGDGFTDLILFGAPVNASTFSYEVLLNDGTGQFTEGGSGPTPLPNGFLPVLAGDFNHDGKLDFAVGASATGQTFSFFYGNGDGTFSAPVSLGAVLGGTVGVANTADLNGDGYTDIVYLESFPGGAPNQIRMLLSGSGGNYTDGQISGLPSPTLGFAVADFTNDHIPDIFATGANGLGLTYAGAGDGTFTARGSAVLATDGFIATLPFVAGDFDNDGNTDIATRTTTFGPNELNFLWGDGTGNFTRQAIVSDASFTLQVGDVNGDGIPDIFEGTDPGFGYPSVTLGQKGRSLPSAQILLPRAAGYLSAGDAFGDGFSDLLVGGVDNGGAPGVPGTIYHAQANGTFAVQANGPAYNTVLVDLNGDGFSDMVGFSGTDMLVWRGDGSGNFQLVNQVALPRGFQPFYIRDMDRDGHMDIVLPGVILYGRGDFQFDAVPIPVNQNFLVGDFDGDGIPDIVTSSGILFGLGNRTFTAATGVSLLPSSAPPFLAQAVADLNGDGKDDLVLGDGPYIELYLSRGRQGFALDQSLMLNGYATTVTSISTGDFNGDGLPDIAVGGLGNNDLVLFTNDGSGKYELTSYAIGVHAIASLVADFNHDGKPDIAFLNYGVQYAPTTVTVLLHK